MGYTLEQLDSWRPSDFREQARLPVVFNRADNAAYEGLSAAEQTWVDGLLAPKRPQQSSNNTFATAAST